MKNTTIIACFALCLVLIAQTINSVSASTPQNPNQLRESHFQSDRQGEGSDKYVAPSLRRSQSSDLKHSSKHSSNGPKRAASQGQITPKRNRPKDYWSDESTTSVNNLSTPNLIKISSQPPGSDKPQEFMKWLRDSLDNIKKMHSMEGSGTRSSITDLQWDFVRKFARYIPNGLNLDPSWNRKLLAWMFNEDMIFSTFQVAQPTPEDIAFALCSSYFALNVESTQPRSLKDEYYDHYGIIRNLLHAAVKLWGSTPKVPYSILKQYIGFEDPSPVNPSQTLEECVNAHPTIGSYARGYNQFISEGSRHIKFDWVVSMIESQSSMIGVFPADLYYIAGLATGGHVSIDKIKTIYSNIFKVMYKGKKGFESEYGKDTGDKGALGKDVQNKVLNILNKEVKAEFVKAIKEKLVEYGMPVPDEPNQPCVTC